MRGLRGLEIGGPSAVFGTGGRYPVYPSLSACDGVQWRASTAWHDLDEQEPYAPEGAASGHFYVADGGTLDGLPDSAWDVVLSSHVIEHFANPLRALQAWRRVLVDRGWVVLVAPHMSGTFDHRRPATTLDHLIADFAAGTAEDDLTHLEETLALHDRARDADALTPEEWAEARGDNLNTRLLHHHVFDGERLLLMLDEAQLKIEQVAVRHPHDIFVLARFAAEEEHPDNTAVLRKDAPWRRKSPFSIDRPR
ncbi:unannotated protein [freshwater metagenome]|uniref:Unannotated protein n=1 Tax=freshwater metagenome TaxID=449393 RepID=A0A6J7GHE8_9ZZZZ